jgi:hypothetical protein
MSKRTKSRGRSERYVSLKYWFMDSLAWKSLPCTARALYLEIARRYNGSNNGRISLSARQAMEALNVSKATAARTFLLLEDRGFIICNKRGAFSMKAVRDASVWRLTEYPDDVVPGYATKQFMSWRPLEPDSNEPPKFRTRYSRRDRTVLVVRP